MTSEMMATEFFKNPFELTCQFWKECNTKGNIPQSSIFCCTVTKVLESNACNNIKKVACFSNKCVYLLQHSRLVAFGLTQHMISLPIVSLQLQVWLILINPGTKHLPKAL